MFISRTMVSCCRTASVPRPDCTLLWAYGSCAAPCRGTGGGYFPPGDSTRACQREDSSWHLKACAHWPRRGFPELNTDLFVRVHMPQGHPRLSMPREHCRLHAGGDTPPARRPPPLVGVVRGNPACNCFGCTKCLTFQRPTDEACSRQPYGQFVRTLTKRRHPRILGCLRSQRFAGC